MQLLNINSLAANVFGDLLNNDILLFYFGELNFETTNQIIKNIGKNLKELNVSQKTYNDVYAACAEGFENAFKHQKRIKGEKVGLVLVSKNKNSIYIAIGNPIQQKDRAFLESSVSELKKMPKQDLTKLIKKRLVNANLDDFESTGIGLIKIILKANYNVIAVFKELENKEMLFILQLKIELL